MISRALLLVVASAVFWLLTALPARHLWGDLAAVHAGVAVLLCLVPAVLTLLWAGWASRNDPRQALLTALGASGVRMFVVLVAALLLYTQVPPFRNEPTFLGWVVAAYLFTLLVEIILLVRAVKPTSQQKTDDRPA